MGTHGTPHRTSHGIPWDLTTSHEKSYGCPRAPVESHGIPWKTKIMCQVYYSTSLCAEISTALQLINHTSTPVDVDTGSAGLRKFYMHPAPALRTAVCISVKKLLHCSSGGYRYAPSRQTIGFDISLLTSIESRFAAIIHSNKSTFKKDCSPTTVRTVRPGPHMNLLVVWGRDVA